MHHGPSKATHRLRLKLEQPAAVLGRHDPRAVTERGRVQLGRPHALCALGVLGLEPGVHTPYVVGGKHVTRQRELLSLVSGVRHVMYYNALYGARCNAHVSYYTSRGALHGAMHKALHSGVGRGRVVRALGSYQVAR